MTLSDNPDLTLEMAFSTDPGDTPVWDDVSEYVRRFSTNRGRQSELDRMEAGTGVLELLNWDRRFEPENLSSPYSPNVVPMRRVRIRGTWDNATHDVFNGFVENWTPGYTEGGFHETVTVPIVDGFTALAHARVSATYSAEASGTRVTNVLDSAGWPAGLRTIDAGQATVPGLTDESALSHLQEVAEAELGLFYATREGSIRFMQRHAFFTGVEDYPNHTWGDEESGSEWLYRDIVLDQPDENIWNDVRVTRVGGSQQTVSDVPSQDRYFRRTLAKSGVLVTTDNAAVDIAQYWLNRYREVDLRVKQMSLRPAMQPTQWVHVLHADLGDRIRVRRRPVDGGLIEQNVFIEGISHSWDGEAGRWDVGFRLSPVDATANFWILEDPVRGVLDSTTRLGV
jgi:hypothetical protein